MTNRKQKKKKKKLPPSAGPFPAQATFPPLARPLLPSPSRGPSSPAPRARARARHPEPTRQRAAPLSLSRRSFTGSPGPLVRPLVPPMYSPTRSPPTTARPISLPLTCLPARLAPCTPLTMPEPSLHPPPPACPSRPVAVCAITTIMASSSAFAVPPPFPPSPGAYKKDRLSSAFTTPASSTSPSPSPSSIEPAPPRPPFAPVRFPSTLW
jgi:hypothetical protein